MHPGVRIPIFLVITSAACAQVSANSPRDAKRLVWEPPALDSPETLPQATVAKEMITSLRMTGVPIVLDETALRDVQTRFGGEIGASGDASEFIEWLCFYGADANGLWALWLWSSEVGGGIVDGFTLQRLDRNARTDSRCRALRADEGGIELPIALRLGLSEVQVSKILGRPTLKYRNTLIFDHEHRHEEATRDRSFLTSNTVAIALRKGVVWIIHVQKYTENW